MNNLAHQPHTFTGAPVINFAHAEMAAPVGAERLASLVKALKAAEQEIIAAIDAEEQIDKILPKPTAPRVFGGILPAQKITIEGRPDVSIPSSEWFYTRREEIERGYKLDLQECQTDDERSACEKRYNALFAEWDAQEQAVARAVPQSVRDAKLRLSKAHRAYSAAERAIVNLKPTNPFEAVRLLEFVSYSSPKGPFTCDESGSRTVMRNVAKALNRGWK